MRVICKTNTSKLVKGATYQVTRLSNKNGGNRARVQIQGLGSYVVKNFTQMDGTPLPQVDWEDPSIRNQSNISSYIKEPHLIKKGDVLVCRWDSKYLTSGKKYKVSEIVTTERKYGSGTTYKETKIKVEGFNRWLNPYRFRLPSTEEMRDLSLNEIFETPESYVVDRSVRKIDTIDSVKAKKIILSTLFNAMLDSHRNNLSITEWATQKIGRKWDIDQKDFEPYLNLTLQELIDLMN